MYLKEYFKITVVHTFLLCLILGPSDIKVFGREYSQNPCLLSHGFGVKPLTQCMWMFLGYTGPVQ